jgi:hypothetical protein
MPTEKTAAAKLVAAAISSGYTVSVNDGEEWTVKRSTAKAAILDALETTGEDTIRIRDNASGEMIGDIFLVWGNAPDGSELICDHTDNPAISSLVSKAS